MITNNPGIKTLNYASAPEAILGLKCDAHNMSSDALLPITHLAKSALALRDTHRKRYSELLVEAFNAARSISVTGGYRALRKFIFDLEGQSPIEEFLHALDTAHYLQGMELLRKFRMIGTSEPFNSLHANAR
ncbi:hypothetical protein [Noviherbaspirillum aerium]|uniref:hypothetical protein n=1 Tax=Noviherbaspirillum aerium TaxID=2588497 RepID=UPI00124E7668|nr:hypothetical protein [Noviherbaspirillum aerium]